MKKFRFTSGLLSGLIIGAVLMTSIGSFAENLFQFKKSANTLYVDGKKLDTSLYNYQYTNFASIRAVAEALGLGIDVVDTDIYFTSSTDVESEPTPTPEPLPTPPPRPTPLSTPTPLPLSPYEQIKSELEVFTFDGVDYYEWSDLEGVTKPKYYTLGQLGIGTFSLFYIDEQLNQTRKLDNVPFKIINRQTYFEAKYCEDNIIPLLLK